MKKLIGVLVFLAVLTIVIFLVTKEPSKTIRAKEAIDERPPKLAVVKSDLWNSAT